MRLGKPGTLVPGFRPQTPSKRRVSYPSYSLGIDPPFASSSMNGVSLS